jgi:hypothetical protein
MLTLALRLALIAVGYPFALIVAFEIAHAVYCTMYGEVR